jgi:hypothetical protein
MEMLKNIPQLAARVFRQERIHDTGTMREPQLREAKAKENRGLIQNAPRPAPRRSACQRVDLPPSSA